MQLGALIKGTDQSRNVLTTTQKEGGKEKNVRLLIERARKATQRERFVDELSKKKKNQVNNIMKRCIKQTRNVSQDTELSPGTGKKRKFGRLSRVRLTYGRQQALTPNSKVLKPGRGKKKGG